MEIPYKYIVLVLVILAIVCVIMTVECFSSNDDEEFKEIKDKIMEGYNQENIDKNYVSADSIIRNMNLDDEKNILVTPRFQLATKLMSSRVDDETSKDINKLYHLLFEDLKVKKNENVFSMNFNEDTNGNLDTLTVGQYLEDEQVIDRHLEDILNDYFPNFENLTRDQQGLVYRTAKTQLNKLMQKDVKDYHEAIRYAPLKEDESGQVEFKDGVSAIPGADEFIQHLLGEPIAAEELETHRLISEDANTSVDTTLELGDNKYYKNPEFADNNNLDTMVNMLTYAGQNFLNIDTSKLDFISGNIEIPFSEDFQGELHTQDEINNALEKFVIDLKTKPEDENNLEELAQLQESRELPVSLRRRVRYNRDLIANAIANILNSRAIQKGWDWKKDIANYNIVRKTNINPNIIYSTPLSKIARILNVDESNIFDSDYPAKYKILRAGGIINSLSEGISSETKNFIYDVIFNLEHDQYNSLEETLSLPLTTNLQPLESIDEDASQRQPEEIISNDDEYKMQKIESVLKHTTIEGTYECVPARFVRSDSSISESGELVRLRCNLGLPLYVYDYKPTEKNESSMLQKIGRGTLSGDMIIESYRNGESARLELGDNEVIFITDKSYNTNESETGLNLSNGEFVYETGSDEQKKMIDSKKVSYVIAQKENVEVEVTKEDGSTEIVTEEQRVYKLMVNGEPMNYLIENQQNWTVKELKDKYDMEEEGSTLRFEIALTQQFINSSVDGPESNFDLNDFNLFPITYRDPYPLVPLESLEISRRNFTYPESNDSVPIRIAGESTTVPTGEDTTTQMEVNKKEVLAVYRITGIDLERGTTEYTRDTPTSLAGMNINDGIDISGDGLSPEKALEPILKCSDLDLGLGQSLIFGEHGDVLVQVIRKASDVDKRGQMEKDDAGNVDYNVHRTYIDASNNSYNIEDIDINQDIGWKTQELHDLFEYYKDLYDNPDETDLNLLKLRANCYDLVLINRLIVNIAKSKLKDKNSKLNKRPRNTVSIVLETEKRLAATKIQDDFEATNINENLLNLISDSLSNSQICKSGGSSEISVNEIQNMGIMNFKSIFESNILHVESLNLRNSTNVMLKDINGLGIYFLNHTDVNRLMKAIYGSFNGYIDTDDFQSDTMFGLAKMYEIVIKYGGLETFISNEGKDLSGEFVVNGLNKVMVALDNLRTESTKDAEKPEDIRWRTSEFVEQNWLEENLFSGNDDEFKFIDRNEIHEFLSQVYEKITLKEFFSTRMYIVGVVPINGANKDVKDYVKELNDNIENLEIEDEEKEERKAIVVEYEKRTTDDSFDDTRLDIIVNTLNSNLSKRLGRTLNDDEEKVSPRSQLGEIRNLFVRNMFPIEESIAEQPITIVESSTTENTKEDFSPLDNRSNKTQIDTVISGMSKNEAYFSLENSYSLLN